MLNPLFITEQKQKLEKVMKPQEKGFTAPDGTFYKWDKPTPPTNEDINAIVNYHTNYLKQRKKDSEGGYPDTHMNPKNLDGRERGFLEGVGEQVVDATKDARQKLQTEKKDRIKTAIIDDSADEAERQHFRTYGQASGKRIKEVEATKRADWIAKHGYDPDTNPARFAQDLSNEGLDTLKKNIQPVTQVLDWVIAHNPTTYIPRVLGEKGYEAIGRKEDANKLKKAFDAPGTDFVANILNTPADVAVEIPVLLNANSSMNDRVGAITNMFLKTVGPGIIAKGLGPALKVLKAGGVQNAKIAAAIEHAVDSGINVEHLEESLYNASKKSGAVSNVIKPKFTPNSISLALQDAIESGLSKNGLDDIINPAGKSTINTAEPNYTPKSLTGRPSTPEVQGRLEAEQLRIAKRDALAAGATETGTMTKGEYLTQNWRNVTNTGIKEADELLKKMSKNDPNYSQLKNIRGKLINSLRTGEHLPGIMEQVNKFYDDLTALSNPKTIEVDFNTPGSIGDASKKLIGLRSRLSAVEAKTGKKLMKISDFGADPVPNSTHTMIVMPDGSIYAPKGKPFIGTVSEINNLKNELVKKLNNGETIPTLTNAGEEGIYNHNPVTPEVSNLTTEIKQTEDTITNLTNKNRKRLSETGQLPPTTSEIPKPDTESTLNSGNVEGNTTNTINKETNSIENSTSKQEGPVEYGGNNASSNASSDALRHELGLDELTETPGRPRKNPTAPISRTLAKAKGVVDSVESGKRAPTVSEAEVLQLRDATVHYKNEYNSLVKEINNGIKIGKDVSHLVDELHEVKSNIETITQANKYVGTEQGRALSARNKAIYEDYSPAGLFSDWTAVAGKALDKDVSDLSVTLGDKVVELEQSIAAKEKQILQDALPNPTVSTVEEIQKRRATAIENIGKNWASGGNNVIMNDPLLVGTIGDLAKRLGKIAPDVLELVRTYIDEGVIKLDDLVTKVKDTLSKKGVDLEEGDIHRIIAGEYEKEGKTLSPTAETLKDVRKEAGQTKTVQEVRMNKKLSKLQTKITTGKFPSRETPTVHPELHDLNIKLLSAKAQADEIKAGLIAERELDKMGTAGKAWKGFADMSRSLVASTDLSAPFNQGAFLLAGRPGTSALAAVDMIKALKSPEAARDLMSQIKLNHYYDKALAAGLDLKMGNEFFTSKILDRIPGVSHSERAYNAYLHKLRMDTFANLVKSQERPWFGKFGMSKELSLDELRQTAEYVNTVTGIGTGKVAGAVKNLNQKTGMFFAPGYKISRWKTAFGSPLFNAVIKKNPRLAAQIFKDYAAFTTAAMGTLAMAKHAGYKVELDPKSSSFGKIMLGNVEVDPFGGLLKPVRQLVQARAGIKDATGKVSKNPIMVIGNEVANSLSPAYSTPFKGFIHTKAFNTNYNAFTKEGLINLAKDLLPIQIKAQLEINKAKNITPEQSIMLRIGALMGANINVVNKKESPR
jgi:hypothetical protein